ncbi:hypothetical protein A3F66_01795 [candidate division TM6 bacterium RIFCSPHIGHO2_12_FULL_32_22]|nr:MAG: hypothetical protein A3F66_01795 [candidate division TM6 bacterium RIFCSPHIGHO2_12_FULL_32_22]
MNTLVIEKNGIKVNEISDNKGMWALSDVLSRRDFILYKRSDILEDLKEKKFNEYIYLDCGLKAINDKDFLLFNPEFEDDLDYRLIVPQQAFWDLLDEYGKVVSTKWKKITIDFDGRKFDISVENG